MIAALIGSSTVIRHVQHLLWKVAENDSPVLLTGEPGTGKESLARAIHEKSPRASGPFVPVKCGSMTDENLQVELLGEATPKGFRPGRLDVASGGTLFLDDIVKLSTALQARIVALLQEGTYIPVGANQAEKANVRIICSTGIQIDQAVREGKFREDLYYRLAGCAIYVPPLRERREDIAQLTEHFIKHLSKEKGKRILGITPDAMSAMLQHSWDHNIKELENLIERIVVLKQSGMIEISDLPPRLRRLVTDDIDNFYKNSPAARGEAPANPNRDMVGGQKPPQRGSAPSPGHIPPPLNHSAGSRNNVAGYPQPFNAPGGRKPQQSGTNGYMNQHIPSPFEESSEIDQFIRKDIDLAGGIDFYRVVEEFENRLIAEALRRTNHNKNRAAQLLSMNRTTLVEKLKKRAASSTVKMETGRVKRNPAFTIFDGLGNEAREFESFDFIKDSVSSNSNNQD